MAVARSLLSQLFVAALVTAAGVSATPSLSLAPLKRNCCKHDYCKICPTMPCTEDVPADLVAPPVQFNTTAAPGKLVAQTTPGFGYDPNRVFHLIYLPPDWVNNGSKTFPIIAEYSGNTLLPQDIAAHTHGWGIGQGQTFIWVVLPFISGRERNLTERDPATACNQRCYHGCSPSVCNDTPWFPKVESDCGGKHYTRIPFDADPTIDYALATMELLVKEYAGDATKTIITGHSRGSLASMYFGLYNDRMSALWTAFAPIALFDGANVGRWGKHKSQKFPPYPNASVVDAEARLRRLGGRPVFHAGECISATNKTMAYLHGTGVDLSNFTVRSLGFVDHNSLWALRPSPLGTRAELREWVGRVLDVPMPNASHMSL